VYTDRIDGSNYNRVVAADTRTIFQRLWYAEFQAGLSATRTSGGSSRGPLFTATFDRTGRAYGNHYTFLAIDPAFHAQSGFVNRSSISQFGAANRFTWYGHRGGPLESFTLRQDLTSTWNYSDLYRGTAPLELKTDLVGTFLWHGGWTMDLKPVWETYAFNAASYAGYRIAKSIGGAIDTVAYGLPGRVTGVYGFSFHVATPQFRHFDADLIVFPKRDVEFREGTVAPSLSINVMADWRPSEKIRISPLFSHLHHDRARDGSRIDNQSVARLKVEYQLSRPIFLRFVGQYTATAIDTLHDPQSGLPLLTFVPALGAYAPTTRQVSNGLRVDWLFSYQPNPGTVIFAGYGSSLTEPDAFQFNNLQRVEDGFFVKLSYLFRA
jgi:hypothetical protein